MSDRQPTSKGKEPQRLTFGMDPSHASFAMADEYEKQKRLWFKQWSDEQRGINPRFDEQIVNVLSQYGVIPRGTRVRALQLHTNAPRPSRDTTDGSFRGKRPTFFDGDRSKAAKFLKAFTDYWISNKNNTARVIPYQRTGVALSFIRGPKVEAWKAKRVRELQDDVKNGVYLRDDEDLWTKFKKDFNTAFADMAAKEKARNDINKLGQKGMDDVDEYITQFKELLDKLGWDRSHGFIVEMFIGGLLNGLLRRILDRDIWPESLDKWQNVARLETRREVLGGKGFATGC